MTMATCDETQASTATVHRSPSKKNECRGLKTNHKTSSAQDRINYFSPEREFVSIQYTSNKPVILGPSLVPETDGAVYLNDFSDLTPVSDLIQQYSPDEDSNPINHYPKGVGFRIVFLSYDAASIRDHVARCKSLLDGNPPCIDKLIDELVADASKPPQGEKQEEQNNGVSSIDGGGSNEEPEQKTGMTLKDPCLPVIAKDEDFYVDRTNLLDFYNLACGENEDMDKLITVNKIDDHGYGNGAKTNGTISKTISSPIDGPSKHPKETKTTLTESSSAEKNRPSISFYLEEMARLDSECKVNWHIRYSGFHPPPSHRKMLGDLAYLEVLPSKMMAGSRDNEALILNEATAAASHISMISITATSFGFYVNRSAIIGGQRIFNPSPSDTPCYSHSLLDCILQRSEPFRKAWVSALF